MNYYSPYNQFYMQDLQNMRDKIDQQMKQFQQPQIPNTPIKVSTPQPNVTYCLSILSKTIRTNIARNMITAKISAAISIFHTPPIVF